MEPLRVYTLLTLAIISSLLSTLVVAEVSEVATESAPGAEPRIVRGYDANEGQFPYQAYLLNRLPGNKYTVGAGSLIGQEWVLTAAHVIDGVEEVTVSLGATYKNSPQAKFTVGRGNLIPHPGWNKNNLHNDIGLVRIPRVNYSDRIRVVPLPAVRDKSSFAGNYAIISGWGGTANGSPLPERLKYGVVQIISQEECAKSLTLVPTILCASSTRSGICGGDSGGPLVLAGRPVLVGVISYSVNGCESGLPNGYARVTSYTEWIRDRTGIQY